MILIDASVWIDHLRRAIAEITALIERTEAVTHPFVIGELAMGSLPDRRETLRFLSDLPGIAPASHAEVMALVEWQRLFGTGIGLVDAHLLASVRAVPGALLWTRDRRLRTQAERLGVAYAASA